MNWRSTLTEAGFAQHWTAEDPRGPQYGTFIVAEVSEGQNSVAIQYQNRESAQYDWAVHVESEEDLIAFCSHLGLKARRRR